MLDYCKILWPCWSVEEWRRPWKKKIPGWPVMCKVSNRGNLLGQFMYYSQVEMNLLATRLDGSVSPVSIWYKTGRAWDKAWKQLLKWQNARWCQSWSSVVFKGLRYYSEGPGIDPRSCHWGFYPKHPTQPLKMSTRIFLGVKVAAA